MVGLFRLEADGRTATRVKVKLGRTSVNTVEVKGGLNVGRSGDPVGHVVRIDAFDRVRLR